MPPRLILYHQTTHNSDGTLISLLPLLHNPGVGLTHLNLAAIHINHDPANLTLNDHPPSHPRYITLWAELRILQAAGIKVLGMLGGAAMGTFLRLDIGRRTIPDPLPPREHLPPPDSSPDPTTDPTTLARFERYYAPLVELVRARALDGLDLDVEEPMTLEGIEYLIDRLRCDFGPDFLITLAPVAAALVDCRRNLSGFDYAALEVRRGREIAWYNSQFYCGWGDCGTPEMYEQALGCGWPAEKVVMGAVTNPANGQGYVPVEMLGGVVRELRRRHRGFGGVMGWEYFNCLPERWKWPAWIAALYAIDEEEDESGGAGVAGTRSTAAVVAEGEDTRQVPGEGSIDAADEDGDGDAAAPGDFEYDSDNLT